MAAKVRRDEKGVYWVVIHFHGRRKKKRIGKDKRLAEEVAKKIQAKLVLGTFEREQPVKKPIPFLEFADGWLWREVRLPMERSIAGALAPATARIHEGHVRRYLTPFFGEKDIREIRVAQVQRFHDSCLEKGRPRSSRSIEMILGTLRRILAYAEAQELIVSNPVEVWKRSRGRRRVSSEYRVDPENVLDSTELEAFLAAACR